MARVAAEVLPLGREGPQMIREGNAAFSAGEYDTALQAYNRAQDSMSAGAEPVYNAANVLYMQDRLEEALTMYDRALPIADPGLSGNAAFNSGNTLLVSGEVEQAIESYKQALRLDPDDEDAKYNLELALERLQAARDPASQEVQDQSQAGQGQQQQEDQQPGSGQQPQQGSQTPNSDQQAGDDQQPGEQQQQPGEQQPGEQQPSGGEQPEQSTTTSGGESPQYPYPIPPTGLTEEQARWLVESVGNNAEPLQSRLHRVRTAGGDPPERDW